MEHNKEEFEVRVRRYNENDKCLVKKCHIILDKIKRNML